MEQFYGDDNQEHMVFPGMVYISHPTEYGTLYTKEELEDGRVVARFATSWSTTEEDLEALKAIPVYAAYQYGEEHEKGTITVGKTG